MKQKLNKLLNKHKLPLEYTILSNMSPNALYMCVCVCLYIHITFTFMHLADAFIQSDFQCIQAIHQGQGQGQGFFICHIINYTGYN